MITQMFLDTLSQYPEKALVFELSERKHVQPGYHVTEVMSLTYDTVDCGGVVNHWRETVVQLKEPGAKDVPTFMTAGKFLGIYARVAPKVPIQQDAALRVEYGDAEQPAVHYHIDSIQLQDEQLHVVLTAPGVTCKANDRLAMATPSGQPRQNCC